MEEKVQDSKVQPETELQIIERLSGTQENSCACAKCKSYCHKVPCIGTPQDMLKIAEAGYGDRIGGTLWLAGIPMGLEPIAIVAPLFDQEKSRCTFLTDDDLCELHDKGLKPTEGRLSTHEHLDYTEIKDKFPVTGVV